LLGESRLDEESDARTAAYEKNIDLKVVLAPSKARMWSRIHHPPPSEKHCKSSAFLLGESRLDEEFDARTAAHEKILI